METIRLTTRKEYTILQLYRPKVNAINHQMVSEIRQTVEELENDPKCRGMILTGIPNFFSAGLDVIELYTYDKDQIRAFFTAFGRMYAELLSFSKPMVCGITGYSPAGGTVIAITADYRIMAEGEKFHIGLNEMAVNVQINQKLIDAYSYWLGTGLANQYILEGKLMSVREAYKNGFIHEVCPAEDVLQAAEKKMRQYLYADTDIFRNTKMKLRKELLEKLYDQEQEELEETLYIWWKPEVRARMKFLVDSLKK